VRTPFSLAKNQEPRDQDRDGVKNLAEYREGTSPRQADTDDDGTPDGTDQEPCEHGEAALGPPRTAPPRTPSIAPDLGIRLKIVIFEPMPSSSF
jgi:hypothetical protein